MPNNKLLLIGYRAVGKTAVARALAKKTGLEWIDADDEIERRAEKTIAEIFEQWGEPGFRELEAAVVRDLVAGEQPIISLGGGAIIREAAFNLVKNSGTVVWLRAQPETIQQRLSADQLTRERRPSLTPRGPMAEITELLEQRTPVYEACADIIVDTDDASPESVVTEILRHWKPPKK